MAWGRDSRVWWCLESRDHSWVRCPGAWGGGRNPNFHWKRVTLFLPAACHGATACHAVLGGEAVGTGASSCLPHAHPGLLTAPLLQGGIKAGSRREVFLHTWEAMSGITDKANRQLRVGGNKTPTFFFVCLLTIDIYSEVQPLPPNKCFYMTWFYQERIVKHQG